MDTTKEKPFIDEVTFAQALIGYVQSGTAQQLGGTAAVNGSQEIPDHWTADGKDFGGSICLVHHGLFDSLFRRQAIIPRSWYEFQRQYYSPLADLLDRMYRQCQNPSALTWKPSDNDERHDFHMNRDFWDNETQERTYQTILSGLAQKGTLKRSASRFYKDDVNPVSIFFNGAWHDIPRSYRNLRYAVEELSRDVKYSMDIPRVANTFGKRVPVMFLMGTTVTRDPDDKDRNKALDAAYDLIEANTHPKPKSQEIMYVLAEVTDGKYTPRHIGRMNAYMLEFDYGSPAGVIHYDSMYMVPQDDLSYNEKKSVETSQWNWKEHQQGLIKSHPAFKAYLESLKAPPNQGEQSPAVQTA